MSFSVTGFNRRSRFDYEIPKDAQFKSLHDLYNDNGKDFVYDVKALFINHKSKYGDHPIVVTSNELIDLPKHLLETVTGMINDSDCVKAINENHVGFTIYSYTYNNGKQVTYSVNWLDI